jgi:RNA polymerase II subunit A small phosphatase-like protein
MEKHLLVLDLDETLVHASEKPLAHVPDFTVAPYSLYLRPGVQSFLEHAAHHFRLAVWTSSSPLYARAVCNVLFPDPESLAFIWASDRCTMRRDLETDTWSNTKPLRKLRRRGYDLDRVLVVDDSPEKHTRNYGNLIRVLPFEGDPHDDELSHLSRYLEQLSRVPNVRRIEKRNWRRRLAGQVQPSLPADVQTFAAAPLHPDCG